MKSSPNTSSPKDKKKKSTSLPASTVEYLKAWMMSPEHVAHPYPTEKEKSEIMADTGIELKQLTNWFVNNRKRYWKPRVEARLKQQAQVQNAAAVAAIASHQSNGDTNRVCFKVGLFSPQVDNSLCQQSISNKSPGSLLNIGQPPAQVSPGAHITVNSIQQLNSTENLPVKIESHYIQGLIGHNGDYVSESFPNLTNQQFISPPFTPTRENCNDQNAQVISMGSASSFSDCDSSSTSNSSHDESQEPIITIHQDSPNNRYVGIYQRQRGNNERTMIIGQAIAQSLSSNTDEGTSVSEPEQEQKNTKSINIPKLTDQSRPILLKRNRSVSDFETYSNPATIFTRPRALTLNSTEKKEQASSPKRRFVECSKSDGWQDACRNASHGYDSALPTLEEAALLFGFTSRD